MRFLAADVFLYFLTEQNSLRAKAARKEFEAAESGNQKITTSPLELCNLIFILHNPYGYDQPKERIVSALLLLLSIRNFRLDDKLLFLDALNIWHDESIGFTDAYNRAFAHHRGISCVPL